MNINQLKINYLAKTIGNLSVLVFLFLLYRKEPNLVYWYFVISISFSVSMYNFICGPKMPKITIYLIFIGTVIALSYFFIP
jgi:hypothetical protein